MFAVVVSQVVFSGFPVDCVLLLVYSILKPIESHVHGFAFSLFDGVIEDVFIVAPQPDSLVLGFNPNSGFFLEIGGELLLVFFSLLFKFVISTVQNLFVIFFVSIRKKNTLRKK